MSRKITRLQAHCLALADKLPKLGKEDEKWAEKHVLDIAYYVKRGYAGRDSIYWCQCCGHSEQADPMDMTEDGKLRRKYYVCPSCGRKVHLYTYYKKRYWKYTDEEREFTVSTVYKDFQVLRTFNVRQHNELGKKTERQITEVFQTWFDPKTGKEVIISKPYWRMFSRFGWNLQGDWKPTRHNFNFYNDVYDLDNALIRPAGKIHPVLKKYGWNNKIFSQSVSPVTLWRKMIKDTHFEVLAKTGQYAAFSLFVYRNIDDVEDDKYKAVRVCSRNGYIIKDATLWNDLYNGLVELGLDTRSPHYICPANIKRMHDDIMERVRRKREKKALEERIKEAAKWEKKYHRMKAKYLPITFDNGKVFCHVIQTVDEMREEGDKMCHCVFRMEYYKKKESLILSARDQDGKRLETVEVNLKDYRVVQSRAQYNNVTSLHEEIVNLVNKNMNLIRKAV